MNTKQTQLISLSVFALMTAPVVNAESIASAPTLEGGFSASVAGLILTPSTSNERYVTDYVDDTVQNITPGYDWGIDANIAYFFEDTANGIEASYRWYYTSESDSVTVASTLPGMQADGSTYDGSSSYELNTFDIMLSQFLDIGQYMQMRFLAGVSYAEIEQNKTTDVTNDAEYPNGPVTDKDDSRFTGWGPRLSIDARYNFNESIDGLGIVAGGSVAYLLGDLDATQVRGDVDNTEEPGTRTNDLDSQGVTNFRGNVGIDYVYFFDNDESTLGLEVGYLVDYYEDAINNVSQGPYDLTFSGPYVELKGVF